MSCRIGMTDVEERKQYWKSKHPDLRDWEILGEYETKSEAQKAETEFAERDRCISYPGGDGKEGATWYVYKFRFNLKYEDVIF